MNLWNQYPTCYPNCSCEPAIDGLILQPFAFWTSIAYLMSAWFIYSWHRENNLPEFKYWLSSILLVSMTSFLAHASFSNLSLAMDMSSIVIFTYSFHLRHQTSWLKSLSLSLVALMALTLFFMLIPMKIWVFAIFVMLLGSTYLLAKKEGIKILKERLFVVAMLTYAGSFLLFAFDEHPSLCQIPGIPYGHPTWHIGSAVTTLLLGKWWFGRQLLSTVE